jgi:mannose-1-phosphate guanylyltransferase
LPASTRSSQPEPSLWAVVLAGGIGSRFWPVSTPARPKQLLPLAGDLPLIQQTVDRITPLVPRERLRILTGERLAQPILDALPGCSREQLLLEPRARGTAPVLAWAAHTIARTDPDAVMASLHADHVISPDDAFRALLAAMAQAAVAHGRLFTIGAPPTRPETGYGYIRPGEPLAGGAREVAEFVEKPPREVAERYVAEGYLWNTGLFVWPVALFLEEIRRHTPEVGECLGLLDAGDVDGYFAAVPTLSIDEGLLERSARVAVMPADFRWDDVGAWDAVGRTRSTDAAGNVAVGNAHLVETTGCIAWADDGAVVLFGAENLVVVRAGEITFVAPRERTAELKRLLDRLPPELANPDGGA